LELRGGNYRMNIIAWLRTPIATLIVLCSALLAQLPHAADVFRLIVVGEGWWPTVHSYTYAIALELAVLLFVVQRRNVESYAFAGVSILVNLSYYHLHGVQLLSVAALPAWLVSIALPAAIAQYSHLIAAATDAEDAPADASAAPAASPDATVLHRATPSDTGPAQDDAQDNAPDAPPAPDKRIRAHQLRSEGYKTAEIARMLNVNRSTATRWLGNATVQQNGGAHV
jgi:hypothetical protein